MAPSRGPHGGTLRRGAAGRPEEERGWGRGVWHLLQEEGVRFGPVRKGMGRDSSSVMWTGVRVAHKCLEAAFWKVLLQQFHVN